AAYRFRLLADGRFELVQPPVQVRFADHQGRREPDRGAVCVLGQDAVRREPLTGDAARQRGELDPRPQATAAYLVDHVPGQGGEPVVHVRAELGGPFLVLAGGQQRDHLTTYGAGQRVPAEGRAVLPGL